MPHERPVSPLARSIAAIFDAQLRVRRISQQTAGDHIGVSQQQMSRYMRGTLPLDVDEIQGLCDLLGLDFDEVCAEARRREM